MGLKMKYFVLKPKAKARCDPYARASQLAMITYAEQIEHDDQEFAKELTAWAKKETEAQSNDFAY